MNYREKNLDLLRVISSIMVIALHAGAIYGTRINYEYPSYYFTIGNFYHSITRTAVPSFVLLSGGFLLRDINNMNYKYHYKKTLLKIILPTIIFSIIYVIYEITLGIMKSLLFNEQFNYLRIFNKWLLGEPYYHMWYMYMIIGCYLITPILIKMRTNIGDKKFEKVGLIFMIIGIIIDLIFKDLIWPIQFISYLGYFILGYSLKYKKNYKNTSYYVYLLESIFLLLIIFILTEINIRYSILGDKFYFLRPLSPIVIVSSLLIYKAFLNIDDININIEQFSKHSFNIYLLHAGILTTIDLIIKIFINENPNPIWYIPILIVSVFMISYKLSIILNNITKYLYKDKSRILKICIQNEK